MTISKTDNVPVSAYNDPEPALENLMYYMAVLESQKVRFT
jgi:hypothetical protein